MESGSITSIAISADHSTVAGGHANGSIFTWDTSRASRPFLHIPHLDPSQLTNRTQDGHLPNVAITSLGFLGTRHTALVSADDRGMAFSHLATRGTGSLGRTVKTTRILGRYPGSQPPSAKPIKPSTVLAFASLPLGNIERASDSMGLTAMLTPYLLVIVSTTPVANTQHKSPRPKEVAPHSAMSGCLAWFPAVKLKTPDPKTGSQISKVKLVYCWSNVLTVLDVDEIPAEDKDKPPSLTFKARSRWRCEEAIVAVQWLSRSVIAVLTISQRLIVIEDQSMRMTEAFDLIHKYIYHADLFSKQLHALVEQLDEEDTSMHGVVADAFSMSFKTYKGRIFLLGFNDVSIGSLSNWADRLIALMENGDYMGAIQLATLYYTGDADKLTIGLPEDSELRHSMVQEKLMEIMSASLKYAFNQRQKNPAKIDDSHLQELAQACFVACQSVGDVDFLFDEMYEWFEEGGVEGIFLETLEPYILDRTVTVVPPAVVKALVTHFVTRGWESRLEDLICQMETATLDLDEITILCKQHGLYDALIYVWNQAMNDFITPLIDLLTLLVPHMQDGEYVAGDEMEQDFYAMNAFKIFPYLSYILTGRVYPTEEHMPEDVQSKAKAEIYWFLFSGKTIAWPKGSENPFRTRPAEASEPSFPYLRMILKFDAASFLSLLNEAFEDPFLNESPEKHLNGGAGRDLPEEQIFGLTVDRQYIVSILLEIMNPADFAVDATIYLDMFIARNLPTYSQYLILPGSTLTKVLTGLCNYPGSDLAEDAQLSAEYLLSVYQPPDIAALIPLFKQAGFYRILKRIYKHDEQYGKLLETYFEDPDDRESTYKAIADCLRPQTGLSKRQLHDVHQVIREHSRELVEFDPIESAKTLGRFAPELHPHVLQTVSDEPSLQFTYLRTILEPENAPAAKEDRDLIEQYVRLMCEFDSAHVSQYVGLVQSTDLRLGQLLPTMEKTGVVDGAVILMAREGQIQESMSRLIKHLHTLESALQGLFAGEESDETDLHSAAEDLIKALQKYVHVGLWLCQKQTKMHKGIGIQTRHESSSNEELTPDENLWLSLIDTTVQITRNIMPAIQSAPFRRRRPSNASGASDDVDFSQKGIDTDQLVALLRTIVQHTFTALLTATSSHTAPQGPANRTASSSASNLSFLRILRAFLTRAAESSPSLADLRSVISSIFSAYAYEESILQLSNRLLERSLFVNVKKAVELRQRGWRAKGSTCEACGRRVWGPGIQGNVYEAYERKQTQDQERRAARRALTRGLSDNRGKGKADGSGDVSDGEGGRKGKGKAAHGTQDGDAASAGEAAGEHDGDGQANGGTLEPAAAKDQGLGPLVIFACRHIYHRNCLEAIRAQNESKPGGRRYSIDFGGKEREYRCPIDG